MDLTWSKLNASFAANASICLFEPQGFFTSYTGPSDPAGMNFTPRKKRKANIDCRMVFINNRKKKYFRVRSDFSLPKMMGHLLRAAWDTLP